ncbi:hypothetical protein [Asaia bogorensis]|uniref:hypothetical protein n=1 Tax=Asaia bogorensis TaxID=91915 RepID=UPI000EFD9C93|nr:hypothetical protein [Asaia bogorensis]
MMADCLYRRPASRHTRRVALAALLLAGMAPLGPGGALFGGHAMAAPAHAGSPVVMDAEDLDLSVPCLGRFEIMVDPAMSDGVSIDSSPSGGAHLTMRTGKTQGSSKVLITSRTCAPNARVSILVAPNVGVMIHDSHDTHIIIHGTLASLEASLEAGQLDADTIQSLDLSLRGTEQVHIASLNRAAQVVETGASGLVVDHADLDAFSAQLSETSHLTVTDGRFDVLTLMVENAASARLGGSANTATVSASGTGLVAIPTVSGALTRTGNVQIGPVASPTPDAGSPPQSPSAPTAAPPAPPAPGDKTLPQDHAAQGSVPQDSANPSGVPQSGVATGSAFPAGIPQGSPVQGNGVSGPTQVAPQGMTPPSTPPLPPETSGQNVPTPPTPAPATGSPGQSGTVTAPAASSTSGIATPPPASPSVATVPNTGVASQSPTAATPGVAHNAPNSAGQPSGTNTPATQPVTNGAAQSSPQDSSGAATRTTGSVTPAAPAAPPASKGDQTR